MPKDISHHSPISQLRSHNSHSKFHQNQGGIYLKKNDGNDRKIPVQFYLDENELFVLDAKTKAAGARSRSAFLRQMIVYGLIYEVDYSALHRNNELLGRISGNLNQIAHHLNATGNFYINDMMEVKELMQKVWHIQESMLSDQP